MKVTFYDVQGHVEDCKKLYKVLPSDSKLVNADARLGRLVAIAVDGENGGVRKITDYYTYGEMVAFLTGLKFGSGKLKF